MSVNYIVILRASGIQKSNELEDILKDCNYKIITFPILKIEQLYSKPIQLTNAQALLTTSSNAIQLFSELSKKSYWACSILDVLNFRNFQKSRIW